jgi:hypothetical protein
LTGLAIDLGGSLKRRIRPDEADAAYLEEPPTMIAPRDRREWLLQISILENCAF